MIAADEALDPGQNRHPSSQITVTCKSSDEPLCLAVFKSLQTLASLAMATQRRFSCTNQGERILRTLQMRSGQVILVRATTF